MSLANEPILQLKEKHFLILIRLNVLNRDGNPHKHSFILQRADMVISDF